MIVKEPKSVISYYTLTTTDDTIKTIALWTTKITISKTRVYIIEVNANTGGAVLTRTVNVRDFWPLIPDFADSTVSRTLAFIIAVKIDNFSDAVDYVLR